jgi:predicted nucleic acid-binding protein
MRPFLFDSSLYVSALRRGTVSSLRPQETADESPVWLSSVVLEELYAGANDAEADVIAQMEQQFDRRGRILIPNLTDWVKAGKMLHLLGNKYGYENIGRGRLTNDALIATSAARTGIQVLTANGRDFARLAEFCTLSWQIVSV